MRMIISMCLAVLMAMAAITPVSAADPERVYIKVTTSSNPEATYNSLTKAQKQAFKDYVKPASTKVEQTTTTTMGAYDPNCYETGFVVSSKNFVGVTLWRWTMLAEWCMNATRTQYTYTGARSYGTTDVLFWSWRSTEQSQSINTGANPDRFKAFSQAEFKLCLFSNIGCVTYRYPWISLVAWGLGPSNHQFQWGM